MQHHDLGRFNDFDGWFYLKPVASSHLCPSLQCIGKGCKLLEYVDIFERPKHELISGLGNNKSSSDLSRFKLFVIGGLSQVICFKFSSFKAVKESLEFIHPPTFILHGSDWSPYFPEVRVLVITLAIFSGRRDPQWTVDTNHPKFDEIQQLLKDAGMHNFTYSPEQMPARLGYKGFLVKSENNVELIVGNETVRLQQLLLESIPEDVLPHKNRDWVLAAINAGNVKAGAPYWSHCCVLTVFWKLDLKATEPLPLPFSLILSVFQEIKSSCMYKKWLQRHEIRAQLLKSEWPDNLESHLMASKADLFEAKLVLS